MTEKDDLEQDDYEGTIEQMIVENGLLLHAVVNILTRKGVIAKDELDTELDRLYAEIESEGDGE